MSTMIFTTPSDLDKLRRNRDWTGVPTGAHVGFTVVVIDGAFRAVELHNGHWFAATEGDHFGQVTSPDLLAWLRAVTEPRPVVVTGFTPAGFPVLESAS